MASVGDDGASRVLFYRSYRLYLTKLENEKVHVEQMPSLHLRTIEALALAIEAKDHTTHDHLQRVRVYAIEIGQGYGPERGRMRTPCAPLPCCTTSESSPSRNTSSTSPAVCRRKNSRR